MSLTKVKSSNHLYKDERTGLVLNTDVKQYQALLARRKRARSSENEIQELRGEIQELREMMNEFLRREK